MENLDGIRDLLQNHEDLREELKLLTKTSLRMKEERTRLREENPFSGFYREKCAHFKEDNEHLYVALEIKKRKITEGEARLERIIAALVQKQQQYAQASEQKEHLCRDIETVEARMQDLKLNLESAKQGLNHATEQDAPLKGTIEQNISQLVVKKSGVAVLESQKALQDSQFVQASERSAKLVDQLAYAQSDANAALRRFQLPPDEQVSLETLKSNARRQQALLNEKERLSGCFVRLIRDKASLLEQYKETRGIAREPYQPRELVEIIDSRGAKASILA